MALDKLVDSSQLDTDLTSVANAIRAKSGGSGQLAFPAGFVSEIGNIPSGGGGNYVSADFADYTKPTEFYYDGTAVLAEGAMKGRTGVQYVTMPNIPSVRYQAFQFCSGILKIRATDIPVATVLYGTSFANCTNIVYAVLPSCRQLGTSSYGGVFTNCTKLKGVDLGGNGTEDVPGGINKQAFNGCTQFNILVLRSNRVLPLADINAFSSSKFASGKEGGTLYVPQALIASYQAATNWSTILGYANNSIQAIEGSIYETQYVDGTSIS